MFCYKQSFCAIFGPVYVKYLFELSAENYGNMFCKYLWSDDQPNYAFHL